MIILVCLFYEKKAQIPPVPTLPWVTRKILKLLAKYKKTDSEIKIAELGSGWGGVCFNLSKKFPNSQITGFEISPIPYWFSKFRNIFFRGNINFSSQSFFDKDLSKFDVIICYLSPHHMALLKDKFEKELKPNSIIISNAFPVLEWEPIEQDATNILVKIPVYVYRIK